MLGDKIRKLRTQLGLSQQQLAGKEMTRAFISQIENGYCNPSPETLQIIAERLGKCPEYFQAEGVPAVAGRRAEILIKNCQKALDEKQYADAILQAQLAIEETRKADSPDLETQAQFLLGDGLKATGDFSEALEAYEAALNNSTLQGNRLDMARAHYEMGNCAYRMEELPLARREYQKVLHLAEGSKRGLELRIKAYLYLGSACFRLGDREAAIRGYKDSMALGDPDIYPELWADAAMGLGAVYHDLKQLDEAIRWNKKSQAIFQRLGHRKLYDIIHITANVEMSKGNWEHGYALLMRCLEYFKSKSTPRIQASVLEDIARYHIHAGKRDEARRTLLNALDLLDIEDNGFIRGRIYRQLGLLEARCGNRDRSHNYLLISWELLKRIKATEEALISLEHLVTRRKADGTADGTRAGAGKERAVGRRTLTGRGGRNPPLA